MLRSERIHRPSTARAGAFRGLAILALATGLGACSAGLGTVDLAGLGGDQRAAEPTGTVNRPVPREPMLRDGAPTTSQPYRRPGAPASETYAPPPPADRSVRMSGLPDPNYPAERQAPLSQSRPPAPQQRVGAPVAGSPAYPVGDSIAVRQGDTLFGLAKRHRVSISELMRVNNLTGANIMPGQSLVLPAGKRARVASVAPMAPVAVVPPAPIAGRSAIVPPLEGVARRPSPTVSSQQAPASEAKAPAAWSATYTIARGDSLYGIARRHRVSLAELQRVNSITDPRKVKPGLVIKLPGTGAIHPMATPAVPARAKVVAAEPAPPTTPPPALGSGEPEAPFVQPRMINGAGSLPRTRVASLPGAGPADQSAGEPVSSPAAAPIAASPAMPPQPAAGRKLQDVSALSPPSSATVPARFRWPAKGKVIAPFSKQPGAAQNDGINISVPRGADVHAAEAGQVTYAGSAVQGYGNLVLIRHGGGWITAYAHNDNLLVKVGDSVRRGQVIAKAGMTGSVSQPQVHFELRKGTQPVDPVAHLEVQ